MSCSQLSNPISKNYCSPDMISSAQKKNLDLFRTSATSQAPCLKNRSTFQRQFSGVDKIISRGQAGEAVANYSMRQETTCRPCVTKGSAPVQKNSPAVLNNVCVVAPGPSCSSGAGTSCGRAISVARSCSRARWVNPRPMTNIGTTNNGCTSGCSRDVVAERGCVKGRCSDVTVVSGGHLVIGTCVLIAAIPDVFRPAGQSKAQQILAVVMYVTKDGYYKLGTWKGAIGKMFSRDEITVSMKTGLTLKDVPDRTINMREASSMSF